MRGLPHLPEEIVDDILAERLRIESAERIQVAWRRGRSLFSHARWKGWKEVRGRIEEKGGDVGFLSRFSYVRKEWKEEGESWRFVTGEDLSSIQKECCSGMWGRRDLSV